LNTAGAQIPPLLFASTFGAAYAGFYALAHRLIAMPMELVGQAVGQVFLSDAPAQYRSGELAGTVDKVHKVLIRLVLPPVAFLILFGPSAFAVVFGEEWRMSGEAASWLSLWMLMAFTTSPLSSVFIVAEKQYLGMIMQAVLLVLRVSGIGVGVYYEDFIVAVIFFSMFNVLGYLVYHMVSFRVLGMSWLKPVANYFVAFIVLVTLGLVSCSSLIETNVYVLVLFSLLVLAHYGYFLKELKHA